MHSLLAELEVTQYESLYHVDDAPIADVRQRILSRLGWLAVVLTMVGAGLAFVIRFPDMIAVPFVVKSEVAEDMYRFPSTIYVEKTFVKPGQTVAAGTPLLEVSAPDVAALVSDWSAARTAVGQYEKYRTVSADKERQIIALTVAQIREDIRLKETQIEVQKAKWTSELAKLKFEQEDAQRIFKINQDLYRTGDISKNDLNNYEATLLRAQAAYQSGTQNFGHEDRSLRQQIETKRLEMLSLEKQLTKRETDFRGEGAQLRSSLDAVHKRIEGRFGKFEITPNNHLILKAERAGTVSFVFDGEKEAAPGAMVLKMIYQNAPLYAYTQVNSSRIGQVKVGQEVVLKLDAYPVYEWGTVRGRVSQVSITPDEKGLFNVQVQLTDFQRLDKRVRIGMQGHCNIIFDERTLSDYTFRHFKKIASEVTE
ncbi:HlyD family secretion protein [Larkinella terrae]|uniref:HlyD family efflux transporter periplasmic adaptor subunit n=1 Tax=Larkinella terrae TaxID=2025311 RepID=A0A7K0EP17_9BACT|nr:HlyD family efflux transporter periplasmic adaptor subunit [Larkinella terrae]MRS63198.1 HlyD family efflux transporter periplasmic adaptor subunit [Larkinella terrae]